MSGAIDNARETANLWHARFKHQLDWTRSTRDYIYRQVNFARASTFLELGCGTGALLEEIANRFLLTQFESNRTARLAGIDLNADFLNKARSVTAHLSCPIEFKQGDASHLPFPDNSFDLIFCHYFLMWNPPMQRKSIIAEVGRVLKTGGWFVAFAEPDYEGWILEPHTLLRERILDSLSNSGGDIASGRRLSKDFSRFKNVTIDCCSKVWTQVEWRAAFEAEWRFFENLLVSDEKTRIEIARLKEEDKLAIENGTKLSFLPVMYAFGRK